MNQDKLREEMSETPGERFRREYLAIKEKYRKKQES